MASTATLGALLLALAAATAAASNPLIHCPRNEQLNQCTGKAFERIINSMLTGDPAHGVPDLDPLVIPFMDVSKDAGSVLNLNLTFSNMRVTNVARDVVISLTRFDPDKLELYMEMHRPEVDFQAQYRMKGKVLWLPIWGTGTFTMRMTGVNERFSLSGKRVKRGGKVYWWVTKHTATLEPKQLVVNFDNLFDGNRLLGRGANSLLNSQWRVIYGQLHGATDATFSRTMKPHFRSILLRVPLSEAFPGIRRRRPPVKQGPAPPAPPAVHKNKKNK